MDYRKWPQRRQGLRLVKIFYFQFSISFIHLAPVEEAKAAFKKKVQRLQIFRIYLHKIILKLASDQFEEKKRTKI